MIFLSLPVKKSLHIAFFLAYILNCGKHSKSKLHRNSAARFCYQLFKRENQVNAKS